MKAYIKLLNASIYILGVITLWVFGAFNIQAQPSSENLEITYESSVIHSSPYLPSEHSSISHLEILFELEEADRLERNPFSSDRFQNKFNFEIKASYFAFFNSHISLSYFYDRPIYLWDEQFRL